MLHYSDYISKLPYQYSWIFFGRILGMFPIAVTSLSISSKNLLKKLKKNRYKSILICFINIFFLIKYDIFIIKRGIVYSSILFNIAAINFFFAFSLIGFEKIENKNFIKIIKFITQYTGGIYYVHWIIKKNLEKIIMLINNKTFKGCIIIYFLSYIICCLGMKIFKKTKFKNLFT